MSPAFTSEDDFVKRATVRDWFQAGPGSLVQTPDGKLWTIVYNNLDGYGVVEGDEPDFIDADGDDLVEPTHMLREPYPSCKYPCVGDLVRVLRRVMPDGTVRQNLTIEQAGAA